jgi:hypothetical protein
MEKELAATTPLLASKLGTDLLAIPSPSRPFGAALPRNEPVWICPQLKNSNEIQHAKINIRLQYIIKCIPKRYRDCNNFGLC